MTRDRGYHLIGTLVDCRKVRFLNDNFPIYKLLQKIPKKIGMSIVCERENPLVYRLEHPVMKENYGITGMCILWQSHISLHTWVAAREVDFDVFSCEYFDPVKPVNVLKSFFGGRPEPALMIDRNTGKTIWKG